MRKIALIVLVITIIILSTVSLRNRASQDTILSKEINGALEQGAMQIDLTTMTKFEWDAVEVFGPYTTNEMIEETMDIRFKGDNGGIDLLDDRFLLVFADRKKAIKTAVLTREYGDYIIEDHQLLIEN